MIGLIQRVTRAEVKVAQRSVGKIDNGFLVLLGIEKTDSPAIAEKLADKILALRVFSDTDGKMNLNVKQVNGELLIVSQFTLVADTKKGNRPGFSSAASPEDSKVLYEYFTQYCRDKAIHCEQGQFGADMQVSLVNDGPVTFHLHIS